MHDLISQVSIRYRIGTRELFRQAHEYFNHRKTLGDINRMVDLYARHGETPYCVIEYCNRIQSGAIRLNAI